MLAIVGACILGGSIFYFLYSALQAAETSAAENRLGLGLEEARREQVTLPFYIRLTRPMLKGSFLQLAVGFWKPDKIQQWKVQLISAGLGRYVEAEQFVASKFYMAAGSAFMLFMIKAFADDPPPGWIIVGIPAFCFFYPNLHLGSLRTARQIEIRLAMPYVVDLLTLSIEAGLDFIGAIGKVVEKAPQSPFIEELSTLLKDIQLGKTRAQALRAMSDRIDMPEMSSFVAIVISSDQMGASIGNVLRAQSDSMRVERLSKAEKMGAQASQKILIPLVVFIMPAVMVIIFGPFVLKMFGGGGL